MSSHTASEGLGINPQDELSAVGVAPNWARSTCVIRNLCHQETDHAALCVGGRIKSPAPLDGVAFRKSGPMIPKTLRLELSCPCVS